MSFFIGLDEKFGNVFWTITKKILSEHVYVDDEKALLPSKDSRFETMKALTSSSLLTSVNLNIKSSSSSSW